MSPPPPERPPPVAHCLGAGSAALIVARDHGRVRSSQARGSRTRLALPPPLPPAARPPFPLVASIAPVVMALAMWAITGSPYVLLFAVFGPVAAIAGVLDGLRRRRRDRRRHLERAGRELDELERRIGLDHERRRSELASQRLVGVDPVRTLGVVAAWNRVEVDARAIVGLAESESGLEIEGEEPDAADDPSRERVLAIVDRASRLPDAPLLVDAAGIIGIVGPVTAGRALAREIALQLAARLSPRRYVVQAPASEDWVALLPHDSRRQDDRGFAFCAADDDPGLPQPAVYWARDPADLPGVGTMMRLPMGEAGQVLPAGAMSGVDTEFLGATAAEARARARALAALATRAGVSSARQALPGTVPLAALLPESPPGDSDGLVATFASDSRGAIEIDLLKDGPHALVAGTTGSGKSEALISWVLALAARYSPSRLALLLVDFKGGSSFAPLRGLPHLAGMVSDLDGRRATRAMTSLRAELERRERLLAVEGARSIEGLAAGRLPRLVVAVDEYAAVVAEHPDLHEVFADLSARGRSLGIHLMLCTQRPTGVVRDAILANVTLRLALRMTDPGESRAMIGSAAAAGLRDQGRAILRDGSGTREVQLAIASPQDVERITSASPARRPGLQPWSDPLPTLVEDAQLDGLDPDVLAFGLRDLPQEQRHDVAGYDPREHGALLVIGAPRSGRTTALATLAAAVEASGRRCAVVPGDPVEAWEALGRLERDLARDASGIALVLIDDLDLLLGSLPPDHAADVADRLAVLLRRAPASGVGVALSAARLAGVAHSLATLIASRLVLRLPSREEHLLVGLPAAGYDPRRAPGSGFWLGDEVQVARAAGDPARALASLADRDRVDPPELRLSDEPGLAVVASRPQRWVSRWRALGLELRELGAEPSAGEHEAPPRDGSPGVILVGDPDAWQSSWALLAAARRDGGFLVEPGIPPTELRTLTRVRDLPPPLRGVADGHDTAEPAAGDSGEWWHVAGGEIRRVRVSAGLESGSR